MLEKDDLIYKAGELAEKGETFRLLKLFSKEASKKQEEGVIQQAKDHALRRAAKIGNVEVVSSLLQVGANPNVGLMFASAYGNVQIVDLLIKKGADVNENDSESVYWAIKRGHHEIVARLLSEGAQINKNQAVKTAKENGDEEMLKVMNKYL